MKIKQVCGAALAGMGVLVAMSVAHAAAYTYEATTTTRGPGMGRNGDVMRVRASVDGAQARIEFLEAGSNPIFGGGGYMVTQDGGKTLMLINTEEMTYSAFDINAMLNMAGSMMNALGGAVSMEFSDFVNEKLAEGPGEPILGYDTKHYEFRTGYTMNMRVMGFNRSSTVDTHSEFWCTDEISAEGFSAWLRPDRFRTGNAEFDELIEQQYGNIDCLPLRMRTTSGDGSGSEGSVSETEVTLLDEVSGFDASIFAVPDGYTEKPLIPVDLEMPSEESAPAEPEGGRFRLRDLLRR